MSIPGNPPETKFLQFVQRELDPWRKHPSQETGVPLSPFSQKTREEIDAIFRAVLPRLNSDQSSQENEKGMRIWTVANHSFRADDLGIGAEARHGSFFPFKITPKAELCYLIVQQALAKDPNTQKEIALAIAEETELEGRESLFPGDFLANVDAFQKSQESVFRKIASQVQASVTSCLQRAQDVERPSFHTVRKIAGNSPLIPAPLQTAYNLVSLYLRPPAPSQEEKTPPSSRSGSPGATKETEIAE